VKLARPVVTAGDLGQDIVPLLKPTQDVIDSILPKFPIVNHLMVIEGKLVVLGMVITGAECMTLPWRLKKSGELATANQIGKDIALVEALYVRGKVQGPEVFRETKCFIREDIK
jgi:hypothetical protein